MTVEFENNENVKTRLRRRRRKIICGRRNRAAVRIRGLIIALSLCLITCMAGYIGAHDGNAGNTGIAFTAHAEEKVIYKNVVVQNGDTIWGIADRYVEPSKDIRKLVSEICGLNDIEPGSIYPGQIIMVPVCFGN